MCVTSSPGIAHRLKVAAVQIYRVRGHCSRLSNLEFSRTKDSWVSALISEALHVQIYVCVYIYIIYVCVCAHVPNAHLLSDSCEPSNSFTRAYPKQTKKVFLHQESLQARAFAGFCHLQKLGLPTGAAAAAIDCMVWQETITRNADSTFKQLIASCVSNSQTNTS